MAGLKAEIDKLQKEQYSDKRVAILDKLEQRGLKDKFKMKTLSELKSIMEGIEAMPNVKQFGGETKEVPSSNKLEVYNWQTRKYEFR